MEINNKTMRVAIVDDKQPNRVSLQEKLNYLKDIEVAFLAANGEDFLAKIKAEKRLVDVVLMDIDMPIMNGIEAVNIAAGMYPDTKFLMLTVFDDDDKIFEAIKAGAIGYLLKDENVDKIVEALWQIVEFGGSPMSPRIARKALQLLMKSEMTEHNNQQPELSEREMDILKALVQGLDYKGAAEKLFISPHTVRTHITNIYKKLHVTNKTQAVLLAIKKGWIS
jgi:DNA-binding NarL/FixJ family response regulator